MQTNLLHAILVGAARDERTAEELARTSRSCPFSAAYFSTGRMVTGLFAIPPEKKWWLEIPAQQPDLMGLETVEIFYPRQADYASPWSRGEVSPSQAVAPCGSHCDRCPQYRERCSGCPATVFFLPGGKPD